MRAPWSALPVSIALFGSIALVGCAGATPPAEEPHTSPKPGPIVLDELRITQTDPADLERMFQEASAKLARQELDAAAAEFDRIVAVEPKGRTAAPSLYNAGLAYAGKNDLKTAAQRFKDSVALDPHGELAKPALIRVSRMYAFMESWQALVDNAAVLLARSDLTVLEQIEGMGAKGLGLVELGRVDEAFDVIVRARNIIEDKRLGEAGNPPLELAQVSFALGEIRRLKSERIVFDPVPADFGTTLEDRCTGLLDAQSAYTDAMRSLDSHWSAMAGYRVGQLYQQLHHDVMVVPAPAAAKTLRQKQLWEGAMRLRYRILLEKGLKMMEGTVALGERTGETSAWIARARDAKKDLATGLETEKEALSKLPFTEDEIRTALDDLKKKKPPPAKP